MLVIRMEHKYHPSQIEKKKNHKTKRLYKKAKVGQDLRGILEVVSSNSGLGSRKHVFSRFHWIILGFLGIYGKFIVIFSLFYVTLVFLGTFFLKFSPKENANAVLWLTRGVRLGDVHLFTSLTQFIAGRVFLWWQGR